MCIRDRAHGADLVQKARIVAVPAGGLIQTHPAGHLLRQLRSLLAVEVDLGDLGAEGAVHGRDAVSYTHLKIDSAGKPAKDFNDSYFISFSRQYELYTRILKGAPYPYSCLLYTSRCV